MKALVIVALCVLGLWGICKLVDLPLSNKQRNKFHQTMENKVEPAMRKAYDGATKAVDKAFQPALDWTEKEWPKVFGDFMKNNGG